MPLPTIIIGAGVGGLTTGALLSHDGHEVVVLEKSAKSRGTNCIDEIQKPCS